PRFRRRRARGPWPGMHSCPDPGVPPRLREVMKTRGRGATMRTLPMPSIMRSLSGLALAAAAAAFVAAGCTQTAVRPAPGGDPAGNALRLEAAGDHDAAAAEYLRLAKSYPDRAAHYRLLAAEAQLAAGRRDEARASLGAAGAKNPEDRLHARIVEARLALAD